MTDAALRRHERKAATGDLGAAARLLRERVRRGELRDEQIELAAISGSNLAQAACMLNGYTVSGCTLPLVAWLQEVQRYARKWETGERECRKCSGEGWRAQPTMGGIPAPGEDCVPCQGTGKVPTTAEHPVMIRAALAAVWAAAHADGHVPRATCPRCGCNEDGCPVPVADAAEAWLANPTDENAANFELYVQECEITGDLIGLANAIPPWAHSLACGVLRISGRDIAIVKAHPAMAILLVAGEVGERTAKSAVSAELIPWILSEEVPR